MRLSTPVRNAWQLCGPQWNSVRDRPLPYINYLSRNAHTNFSLKTTLHAIVLMETLLLQDAKLTSTAVTGVKRMQNGKMRKFSHILSKFLSISR